MTRVAALVGAGSLVACGGQAVASAHPVAIAPGGPGARSYFDEGRKDCLGTATENASKVWYTVADGVLSDVYEPTIDNTDVQTLQYLVTDGSTFTDLQTRDTTYTVRADPTGMACTVTSTSKGHGYRLVTTYITDPARDTVLIHTTLHARGRLHLYARVDAHVNGNGGGGPQNGGADTGALDHGVPVISDISTTSEAVNRDYAVPTFMALTATRQGTASVGYAGTGSDGLTQLDRAHRLTRYSSAPNGHVTATEEIHGTDVTLALGFGRTRDQAVKTAETSLKKPFSAVERSYAGGWGKYDKGLKHPPGGMPHSRATYYLDANVLKASEDKSHPGAVVASLASPWGQAVDAGTIVNGAPVYFGSYREVFARDLYEAFTGFLADGDLATARAATRFLLEKQQLPTGEQPRNSLVNGKVAPDTGGDQLDETAYPILMAYQSGLGGDATLWSRHIRPAADFLVAHGPSYGVERWEEQSGYSPSTIAAEIAGLTAAATIATAHGDTADARLYQATADDFQRNVEKWTVTSQGGYFLRLSKTGDPNAAISYGLGNGGPTLDQRTVIDGGFQELVRLGELPVTDPAVKASLPVLDGRISVTTPTGQGYYRYGNSAAKGSADGYGDCYQPSQTSCTRPGQPWPTTDVGTGHLWPVLSGERAETALAVGDRSTANRLLDFMDRSASGVGLVPEQVWEDPGLPASPYGSDPTTASIGFADGHAAGSASPLTWAQAQRLRLIQDIGARQITERPSITTARYVTHKPPAAAPLTLTSPASGATVEGTTVTVTGTTSPGAQVTVQALPTDLGTGARTVSTRAGSSGAFSVKVPIGFGTDVITASATGRDGSTGHAQVTVVGNVSGGTTNLDVTDPAGDDHGPGTYQYPTASDFKPGSYDLTGFQVITSGDTVYLRTRLATLVPTFGNTMGAQLLDIYVHTPAGTTSTAAAYPSRHYTIAAKDAWSQRIEVQGFAAPVWVDASGHQVGTPSAVVASTAADTITIALPKAAFGTPASGWSFTVVLAGQDGYSSDQARAFAATPQPYAFGVCAPGGTSSICSVDPATVPKVMDVLTPPGVQQSTELDPTRGPVVISGVPVP